MDPLRKSLEAERGQPTRCEAARSFNPTSREFRKSRRHLWPSDAEDLSIASSTCAAVIGLVSAVRRIKGSVESSAHFKVALLSPCLS
jgi:hypothetical protein